MAVNLSVNFCGVKFKNPLVLASGILGITASSWRNVVKNGAGGVTTKSIWLTEHKGHRNPVIIANEHYMLNAVGLPDAGVEKAREEIGKYLSWKASPLIVSIVAGKVADFGEIAENIAGLKPDIIEVNISCPNVEGEFGKPFACVAADAAQVTREVKKRLDKAGVKIPISVKLSPNVENIVTIAKAVVDAGADALTVMNSMGPGMAINLEMRAPVLANKVGGLTGPALKPIAINFIHDIYKALPGTPIIGTGGVMTGEDAIEMMMAGATLVGVGTGVYYRGIEIFKKITDEMQSWCKANKISNLVSLIGAVQRHSE
ncbi:dihydroorotate dehydrogenase [Candidatus Peregrinibacteria bacterium]|nr:dihydroorotate dehydrogenase [Candidatus Peregrinibacteria bacterium]